MKKNWDICPMIEEARATGKGHGIFIELLIFILVFIIASGVEGIPVGIGTMIWIFTDRTFIEGVIAASQTGDLEGVISLAQETVTQMPAFMTILSLFATGLMTLAVIFYCRVLEKRSLSSMGLSAKGAIREYLIGAAFGAGTLSLAVLIGVLTGTYTVSLSHAAVPMLLVWMAGYMVQGMSEEVLCRGYLMVSLSRKKSVLCAVTVSSLVFAALHLANPGINALAFLNLTLCGASFAVYAVKRGNLWGACAMHSFWNFFQGNIFGISVSGTGVAEDSVLSTAVSGEEVLLAGTSFGIESGLCVTVVEALTLLALIFVLPRRKA